MAHTASFKLFFEDFPYICRLCLTKKENLKLIDRNFLDILKNIINFNQELDDLPKNVCNECMNKLEYIFSFISSCIKSETALKIVLENHKIQANSHCEDLNKEHFDSGDSEHNLEKKYNIETNLTNSAEVKLEKTEGKIENIPVTPFTKEKPLNCEICGKCFDTRSTLFEHKKNHTDCRTNHRRCTNCEKTFSTNFRLKLHMRSHTKETPYECKICLKKFRFASNVYRHVDVAHKGLKPFKCDICGKDFARLERKVQHMNVHTNNCPFKCKFCGKTFKHKTSQMTHEMGHKIKNGEITDLSEISCSFCQKVFSSKYLLQAHIEIHIGEKKFLCSVCGKGFLKKCYLDIHSRIHTGEKPFQCRECGKKFKHASSFKTHASFHTGIRCFKCDICLKTFKQSAHLKTHVRVHSGEKPFPCSICGKNFSQRSNLNAHTRIHTGETPYHCPICSKGFYDSSSLRKHTKNH